MPAPPEPTGLDAVVERERDAALRRGSALLGVGAALVPIAVIDEAFAISDQLLARVTDLDIDPAAVHPGAVAAILYFALIAAAIVWRTRVDADARRWLGPVTLALLVIAAWQLGSSVMVVVGVGLAALGVINLRDLPAAPPLPPGGS
ncbi:MAG: hypothetical protein R3A79_29650 [Nannocystaceae bacterium]